MQKKKNYVTIEIHGIHQACHVQFWPPHHKRNTVRLEKSSKKGILKDKQKYVITSVQIKTKQAESLIFEKR